MRIRAATTGLAALAAALAVTAAKAAPGPPWARIGEWRLHPVMAGRCDVRRDYPGGTSLTVAPGEGGRGELFAINRAWSLRIPGRYRLTLVGGGRRRPLDVPAGAQDFFHGLAVPVGADEMAALAAGATVEVAAPDGRLLERLDVSGLAPALNRLGACRAEAATAANFPPVAPPPPPPMPPRRGGQRPARAQANLVSLFSSDDYPAAAVRAREQGAVGFRLDVDKMGRVAACTIVASSGSAVLDAATCRLLAVRARFTPAHDRKGKPTADSVTGRIVWRLPEPEPEPEPAPPPP